MENTNCRRTFHTVDVLRGVAALNIVLVHAAFFFRTDTPAEGGIAVDLFFMISGFIIADRYDGKLSKGLSLAQFLGIRFTRLYPLFALSTLVGAIPAIAAVLAGVHDSAHWRMLASLPFSLVLMPSLVAFPVSSELYPLNYVTWSLALDVAITAIYALTFRFWTKTRLLALVFAGLVAIAICARHFGNLKDGYDWVGAPAGIARIVFGFSVGLLIQRYHQEAPFRARFSWWIIVGFLIATFYIRVPAGHWAWDLLLVAVVMPAVLIAALGSEPPRMLHHACGTIGAMSYVLYSIHVPFINFYVRGEKAMGLNLAVQSVKESICFGSLLAAACLIVYYWFDKPVRAALLQWVRKKPSRVRDESEASATPIMKTAEGYLEVAG